MIDRAEVDDWADRFGVPTEQIERDHLISHMLAAFAAMKGLAWSDRRTPRDLFDLDGLARINAITPEAEDRLRSARGSGFVDADFERVPARVVAAWTTELGAQVGALPDPQQCLERVAAAVRALHSDKP